MDTGNIMSETCKYWYVTQKGEKLTPPCGECEDCKEWIETSPEVEL